MYKRGVVKEDDRDDRDDRDGGDAGDADTDEWAEFSWDATGNH